PEYLNQDPYGKGWIAVVELASPADVEALMTASQYEEFLSSQS
ncbi:MAG: glycine cleavage system protein H, partial [Gammaproteobacteria bacterium]|nr:glycine cleavage system protein H [Gammaproteobacteria bacterium]